MNFCNLAVVLALFLVTACSNGSETTTVPLPIGTYKVEGPFCLSSEKRPHYPEPKFTAALFDFDDLTVKTVERRAAGNPPFLIETFESPECSLIIHRTYISLVDEIFGASRGRKFFWEPEGCTFGVTALDQTLQVGANYNDLYTDSDSTDTDLLFEVEQKDSTYLLKTPNSQSISNNWKPFGCLEPDSLLYRYTKL